VLKLAEVTGAFGMTCMRQRAPGEKVELRDQFAIKEKLVVFRD
jgi:hypothetical protein